MTDPNWPPHQPGPGQPGPGQPGPGQPGPEPVAPYPVPPGPGMGQPPQPGAPAPGQAFPYPYQQPYQPPVRPEPKKSSVWKIVLGVLVAALALMGGCSYLVFRAVSGPIDMANEFLADAVADDFDAAFERLDPTCFADANFDDMQRRFGAIESYNLTSSSFRSSAGLSTGEVSGSATFDDGLNYAIRFDVIDRGQGWAICGITVE